MKVEYLKGRLFEEWFCIIHAWHAYKVTRMAFMDAEPALQRIEKEKRARGELRR